MFSKFLVLLIGCGFLFAEETPPPDPRSMQAARFIEQGRFLPAIDILRQLYEEAKKTEDGSARVAETAADLGGAYVSLDRYAEAEPLANEALRIDRALFGEDSSQAARHSMVLAKLCLMTGRVPEAERMLLHARPIMERTFGTENLKVAGLLNHLGLASDMWAGCSRRRTITGRRSVFMKESNGESC